MKKLRTLLLPFLCFVLVPNVKAQSVTLSIEKPILQKELLGMVENDQAIRAEFIELMRSSNGKPDMGKFLNLKSKMDSMDSGNTKRMKAIIAEHGWPGKSMVGKKGAQAAFLLVQHADLDLDFQKESLELLQAAFKRGEATGKQVALLTDRVRVAQGKPQLYGTQTLFKNGKMSFRPIEDSTNVDKRRVKMGLIPIEKYKEKVMKMYLGQGDAKRKQE